MRCAGAEPSPGQEPRAASSARSGPFGRLASGPGASLDSSMYPPEAESDGRVQKRRATVTAGPGPGAAATPECRTEHRNVPVGRVPNLNVRWRTMK